MFLYMPSLLIRKGLENLTIEICNFINSQTCLKRYLQITNYSVSFSLVMNSAYNFDLYIKGNCSYQAHFQVSLSVFYIQVWLYKLPVLLQISACGLGYKTGFYRYSQTSVPRIPWMTRTDLKVPSIFLIFLSKKNLFRSNTDTSNSRTQ